MKRISITGILLFLCFLIYGQSELAWTLNGEGKMIAVPRFKTYEFKMPEFNYELSYNPIQTIKIESDIPEFNQEFTLERITDRPMDMHVLSLAYRPFFNVYTPMLMRVSPAFLDFDETYQKDLNENMAFVSHGMQVTWPGSGGLTTITGGLAWEKDQWTLSGGIFAGKYMTPFDISPGVMTGVQAAASYQMHERVRLNVWGQYVLYDQKGKNNMFLYANPFHAHTTVGGSMDFKISDNFGIGVGLQHHYNPMRNKWDRQSLIYPILYKNSRIGISPF